MGNRSEPQSAGDQSTLCQDVGEGCLEGYVVLEDNVVIWFGPNREGADSFVLAASRLSSSPDLKVKPLSASKEMKVKGKGSSRATRMTEWSVMPREWVDWVDKEYPGFNPHPEFDAYCNWSMSSKNGAKRDHFAAFRNWIKRVTDEKKPCPTSATLKALKVLKDV